MNLLVYLYFLILAINICTCIYFYKQHNSIMHALFYFLCYTFCNELIAWNDPSEGRKIMPYIYNMYFMIAMAFWTYFYMQNYQSLLLKRISIVWVILAIGFSASLYILHGLSKLQNMVQVTLALSLLILSILYFVDIILTPTPNALKEDPVFWISCGAALWSIIFLFYAGPLFYFVKKSPDLNRITYILLNIVCLINYSLLQIGLMSKGSKKENYLNLTL
jgi:hypothetical protein